MPDIAELIRTGASAPWLFLPLAVLLGALHALEPGHSKSMMAAFIIAVRGSVPQAALLGVAAAIGHTLIIWLLAAIGLWLGDRLVLERSEPWLMLVSGLLVMALGVRIFQRVAGARGAPAHHGPHAHDHDHDHEHAHPHDPNHAHVHPDAADRNREQAMDPHMAAHAADLRRRLAGRSITTVDIGWFGFTAGLLPCPAAFAVLLVCLQLKQVSLGFAMVAAFSIGLAITLVGIGSLAAWGARAAGARMPGLGDWIHRLPYVSAAVVLGVGLLVTLRGVLTLAAA